MIPLASAKSSCVALHLKAFFTPALPHTPAQMFINFCCVRVPYARGALRRCGRVGRRSGRHVAWM